MKLFGIKIRIHPSFWLLPSFLSLWASKEGDWQASIRCFVLVLLIFACVLGHELTHSLRARSLGIEVPCITLYAIGGVASMQRIPRDPAQEFSIAVVGPLFNFVLAAVLFFPLYFLIGKDDLFSPSLESWPRTFANVFWVNPVLGIFNLLPAFPMDGGRILRSTLARKLTYVRATRISVFLGQFFAILFFLFGLWKRHWMLALVGVYVHFSASKEMRGARHESSA